MNAIRDKDFIERLKEVLDIARVCVEILAIVAAGIWAIVHFDMFESSELLPNAVLTPTLDWRTTPDKRCIVTFGLKAQNAGKVTFVVDSLHVIVKRLTVPKSGTPLVQLTEQNTAPVVLLDTVYGASPLVASYRSNMWRRYYYRYLVNSPPQDRLELFATVFLTTPTINERMTVETKTETYPCAASHVGSEPKPDGASP